MGVSIFPRVFEPTVLQGLTGALNSIWGLDIAGTRLAAGDGVTECGIISLTRAGLNFVNILNMINIFCKLRNKLITSLRLAWTGWESSVSDWRDQSISCLYVCQAPWPTQASGAPRKTPCTRYNFR